VYGYGRNTQQYFGSAGLSRVSSNIHQATGGFVFGLPTPARLRVNPYLLAEGGALVFDPTGTAWALFRALDGRTVGVFSTAGVSISQWLNMSRCARNIAVWYATHPTSDSQA